MSDIDVRKIAQEELNNIAPEVDIAAIKPTADLREAMDIDSMDFLNFVIGVHSGLGVDVPEADYGKMATLGGAVGYLASRLGAGSG